MMTLTTRRTPDSPASSEATDDTSAGSTPSEPKVTAPTLPPEADGTSPAAAKAFARHVVDLINYAQRSLDVTPLQAVFDPGCRICSNGIKNVRDLAEEGGHIRGGTWTVDFLRYVPGRPRDRPLIDIVVSVNKERVFRQDEPRPEVNQGFQDNYMWELGYTKTDEWNLVDWSFVE